MDPKPASESSALLAHWMGILDANSAGNIHGGAVMKLCDEAAGLAAIKHSRGRVVTVGMDRMNFLYPIHIGELVTFSATVNAVWRTSMEVGVRVDAENPRTGEIRHTNTAYITMVALDDNGRPPAGPARASHERRPQSGECARPGCAAPTGSPSGADPRASGVSGREPGRRMELPARPNTSRVPRAGSRWCPGAAAASCGPEPGGGFGSPSAEVSSRIPAISMNAWPGFV